MREESRHCWHDTPSLRCEKRIAERGITVGTTRGRVARSRFARSNPSRIATESAFDDLANLLEPQNARGNRIGSIRGVCVDVRLLVLWRVPSRPVAGPSRAQSRVATGSRRKDCPHQPTPLLTLPSCLGALAAHCGSEAALGHEVVQLTPHPLHPPKPPPKKNSQRI